MPLTREELLRASASLRRPYRPIVAGSDDAAQMSHTTPEGSGVPAQPPAAPPAPALPQGWSDANVPVRQRSEPGPAPAEIAAAQGIPAPAPEVPREAPAAPAPEAAPAPQADPDEKIAFDYLDTVTAMERRAMELGRPEEASRVRTEYNRLIDGQYRTLETQYRTKVLPQVQAMQKQLLDFEGKQLPKELVIKARDTVQQAGQQQQTMMAFIYGLVRNDSTKGLGVKYFNESDLLEPGVNVADFIVDDQGMLVGLDTKGGVVKLSSGEDFRLPVEALEQLYNQTFESDRKDNVILPKGAKLVQTGTGATLATNPEAPDVESRGNARLNVKMATDAIARALGIELDSTGRLMEGVDDSTRQQWVQLSAQVEGMVLDGTPPQQAAEEVLRSRAGAAPAAGSATKYNGPLPWRR